MFDVINFEQFFVTTLQKIEVPSSNLACRKQTNSAITCLPFFFEILKNDGAFRVLFSFFVKI